jgi:hypothetical protein
MLALGAIPPETILFSVPEKLFLTVDLPLPKNHPLIPVFAKSEISRDNKLAILLLYEKISKI